MTGFYVRLLLYSPPSYAHAGTFSDLSGFLGKLFTRYAADITPLLSYIVHQLHQGAMSEAVILREIIQHMAAIEPLPSLTDSQIQAMAGGPTLRIEALASTTRGARRDPNERSNPPDKRFGKQLLDSGLALPLLIQVAQQRESCVFKNTESPLKSLAALFDFVSFLAPSLGHATEQANFLLDSRRFPPIHRTHYHSIHRRS